MEQVKIQACIEDLQYVLDNWDEWVVAKDCERILNVPTTRGVFDVDDGLCNNVLDAHLDVAYKYDMFEAWAGYSGSTCYPVGGEEEYEESYSANLYCNPSRMELAKHCLAYMLGDLQED